MKARLWDDTLALFTPIYWRIRWRYYWAERARRRGPWLPRRRCSLGDWPKLFSDRRADSFTILFVADVLHPVDVLAVQ